MFIVPFLQGVWGRVHGSPLGSLTCGAGEAESVWIGLVSFMASRDLNSALLHPNVTLTTTPMPTAAVTGYKIFTK